MGEIYDRMFTYELKDGTRLFLPLNGWWLAKNTLEKKECRLGCKKHILFECKTGSENLNNLYDYIGSLFSAENTLQYFHTRVPFEIKIPAELIDKNIVVL